MMGYTELTLEEIPPDHSAREYIIEMLKASHRAASLIKQILLFNCQSETGREPLQIGPLIKDTIKLLRAALPSTIEVGSTVDQVSALILANPSQIHQILMNLYTNAAQAMKEGGILEVSLDTMFLDVEAIAIYPNRLPGNYLQLTVKDTGIGIDPIIKDKIFDPFFTTKGLHEGTGMGLSVVHGIVERLGGMISVSSEPGQGATFHLFFPIIEAEPGSYTQPTLSSLPKGHEKILLVDDEEFFLFSLQKILERLGYNVTSHVSSLKALEVIKNQPQNFDLIITDQVMPELTGANLAKEIKTIRPDLPIILCTGYGHNLPEIEEAKAIGIREILTKPFNSAKLTDILREILDQQPPKSQVNLKAEKIKKNRSCDRALSILIIDDDLSICHLLATVIKESGSQAEFAHNLATGFEKLMTETYDLVFLDVLIPDGNGLEALPLIKKTTSFPEVIIITGKGNPNDIEQAVKNGAWDYLEKPFSGQAITNALTRILQFKKRRKDPKISVILKRENLVGDSPKMKDCLNLLAQGATSEANILITGETGTGKELLARSIHQNSPRKNENFVTVDCSALPETLVESILFGHEKGAFTGADRAKDGLIKQADQGTLFLDEIGELPLLIQRSFLRVLQERVFRPVGRQREVSSNFRLIAATNRDLDYMVKEGKFRQDLLFRLKTFTIEIPPLRERIEDIEILVNHYLSRLRSDETKKTKKASADFIAMLKTYDWPGNVRELVNTVEQSIIQAGDDPILFPKHLPAHIRIQVMQEQVKGNLLQIELAPDSPVSRGPLLPWRDFRDNINRQYVEYLLQSTEGNDIQI